jgi:hypothetical protein
MTYMSRDGLDVRLRAAGFEPAQPRRSRLVHNPWGCGWCGASRAEVETYLPVGGRGAPVTIASCAACGHTIVVPPEGVQS